MMNIDKWEAHSKGKIYKHDKSKNWLKQLIYVTFSNKSYSRHFTYFLILSLGFSAHSIAIINNYQYANTTSVPQLNTTSTNKEKLN